MDMLKAFTEEQIKKELPVFNVGDTVEVIRKGKVRRAKLFYLRDKVGKDAKVKENI